jgi:hypothetical protein
MLRVLETGVIGVGPGRRLLALGLIALGGVIAPLAVRARRRVEPKRPESIEVGQLEIGGAGYGAVYEDGRLVGVLEGVERL